MATSKEFVDFILEQLSDLSGIAGRSMMGEYIIYYREKIAAYICDNRFLVKIVSASERLLPDAPKEPPYPGAKDMLLVENVENKKFLCDMFKEMYDELPAPKPKKAKKK